jgi:hypothetical protein
MLLEKGIPMQNRPFYCEKAYSSIFRDPFSCDGLIIEGL